MNIYGEEIRRGMWIRGPDCQCATCEHRKEKYVIPLRRAASVGSTPSDLASVAEELSKLSEDALEELKTLAEATGGHSSAEAHFLGWVVEELKQAVRIYRGRWPKVLTLELHFGGPSIIAISKRWRGDTAASLKRVALLPSILWDKTFQELRFEFLTFAVTLGLRRKASGLPPYSVE